MNRNGKKTIGILGGMGPLATADIFKKIITLTVADNDNEHIHILIDNNTNIPDRTQAILHGGADPVPEMKAARDRLIVAGADLLVLPCNTAHYFYDQLTDGCSVPVIHMIQQTVIALQEMGIKRAGLLATDGTIQSGVYENMLCMYGIDTVKPSPAMQQEVMNMIYKGIKRGDLKYDPSGFKVAMTETQDKGAEILILGCTELPLAFEIYQFPNRAIDPTATAAQVAIRMAGGEVKSRIGEGQASIF